jgi:hypothetical protein
LQQHDPQHSSNIAVSNFSAAAYSRIVVCFLSWVLRVRMTSHC